MAKKKYCKRRPSKKRKVESNWVAFWYVVTSVTGASLSGLTLALFLSDIRPIPLWMWFTEFFLILIIFLLIKYGKFTSSDSMALGKKPKMR